MRIAQIVFPTATEYERKSQRIDFNSLSATHEVIVLSSTRALPKVDVAHIYAGSPLPPAELVGFSTPYVSSSRPERRRFAFRRTTEPRAILSPLEVPEAVDEAYFVESPPRSAGPHIVGSFARPQIANIVEQTLVRIGRFRQDVEWALFDHVPSPIDLAGVEVWADPSVREDDLDGFVAEAIAAGRAVVASRTAMNAHRLENGRTGWLVPRHDPNELTHAILAALFKPELARSKIEAAKQTAGKFRPRQRLRVLERIYQDVLGPGSSVLGFED